MLTSLSHPSLINTKICKFRQTLDYHVRVLYTNRCEKNKKKMCHILKEHLHGGVQSTWEDMRPWVNKHCTVPCQVCTGTFRYPPNRVPQTASRDAGSVR